MKRISGRYIIPVVFAIVFGCNSVFAVPAKPGLITMRQADGTEIKVRIMGDEHSHYYLSEDGYLLINDNDIFYYGNVDATGNIVNSQIAARPAARRSAAAAAYLGNVDMTEVFAALERRDASVKASRNAARDRALKNKAAGNGVDRMPAPQKTRIGLFDTGFPSTGNQKGLVVLVEYQDVKFNLSDPYGYFSRMLNENGFSDYGGTGCAAEYFRECSMNQFRPQFDVYGPITLSQNMSYYGGNDTSGDDKNPHKMAIEACQQLDATVDFSEYDRDGDGYIDNVFVFYAGRGEASGGSANTVWPHAWNVTAAEYYTSYIFDGVQLDRYACSNEWEGSRPDGVGTFIHEFSHVMGLPDLYATSYTSAFTPGAWSVLDYGPYNNGGCTPPLYSAYERYSLGWMSPRVLDGPANIMLNSVGSNEACIIPTGDDNEFFLLENRQQTGWDKYIPGHGMLVWHVDYDTYVWSRNVVNNNASHQYVDIEEADGTQNETSRSGDAFPGRSNITSFTDDTRPSMKTWSGARLNLPITDIKETGGTITFKVAGGFIAPHAPVAEDATDITPVSFTANWQTVENANTYYISIYTKNADGKKTYVVGYNKREVGNVAAVTVTGLHPLTTYYYTVCAANEGVQGEESDEICVTTTPMTFEYTEPVALYATDVTVTSFIANWQAVDDAEEYFLRIYSKEYGEPESDIVDFTDGVKNLPEGWNTNSTQSYANKSYSGEAIPSLRFIQTGNYIESPEYPKPVRRLSFWHRGSLASDDNSIIVSVQTGDGKWHEAATVEIENAVGGAVTVIDDMPDEAYKIRIAYNMPGKGSLAIDDITVGWGGDVELKGEILKTVKAPACSIVIDGLLPATTYYYSVQAAGGGKMSKMSNEIRITTASDINTFIAHATGGNTPSVSLSGDILTMTGVAGRQITVADVYGRTLFATAKSATGNAAIRLPSRGIYIVRIGHWDAIKIKR